MSARSGLARVARALVATLPGGTALPVLSGPLRGAAWVPAASNLACWSGTFERETQRFVASVLRPGDLFVDVGAHVGFFTLLGARCVGEGGRVLAIEPLPESLAALERHLALNRARNVMIRRCALSSQPGRARFGWRRSTSHARFLDDGEVDVEVETLDGLLADLAAGAPRLIKIDVEGHEAEVLAGAARTLAARPRPALAIATHGWQAHAAVLERLAALGFDGVEAAMDERSGNGTVRHRSPGAREAAA